MRFQSRIFFVAKDVETPEFYEDAFHVDAESGAAAIGDGVASAIFSGIWARILTEAVVVQPPNLEDPAEFQAWLTDKRAAWRGQIDLVRVPLWRLGDKMAIGAMTTLLWVTSEPINGEADAAPGSCRLRSFAIGDCCLFHVRGGQWLSSFPLQSAAEFDLTPNMIGSVDRKQDHLLEFQAIDGVFQPGDTLALCTDALAMWALGRREAGAPVNWDDYWDMPDETWQAEIATLRAERQMRYDDTTLVLLRMADESAAAETPSSETAVTAEGADTVVEIAAEPIAAERVGEETVGEEAVGEGTVIKESEIGEPVEPAEDGQASPQ